MKIYKPPIGFFVFNGSIYLRTYIRTHLPIDTSNISASVSVSVSLSLYVLRACMQCKATQRTGNVMSCNAMSGSVWQYTVMYGKVW